MSAVPSTELTDGLVTAVRGFVRRMVEPLELRVKALEAENAELRERLKYCGVYTSGASYQEGNIVTHSGSAWYAQRGTSARPGESDDWKLMVKRGRDALKPGHGP